MKVNILKLFVILTFLIPQSLSAQATEKAEVTRLYQEYFCPADQFDSLWNGNFLQIYPGDVSAEYKDAVLKRLLFMRALAGQSNNIQILPELSAQAQKLSFFLSLNLRTYLLDLMWDPFRKILANAGNPEFDPFALMRLYSSDLPQIAANSLITAPDSMAHGLVDIIRTENGKEDGNTNSAGEWDRTKVGYPLTGMKMLSPHLSAIGIGTVETNVPVKLDSAASPAYQSISTGVLTMNPIDLHNAPAFQSFSPVLWPPPGYVPYVVSGPKWHAYLPGSDMRGAFVSVRQAGDTTFEYKAELLERDATSPVSSIAWSMRDFPGQGEAFKHITGEISDRIYDVTIGNILFNGEVKQLQYRVIEYNPFTDLTKTRLHIELPAKIKDSEWNFLRLRVFTDDGCLLRVTRTIPGRRVLVIRSGYATSPEGPFEMSITSGASIFSESIFDKEFTGFNKEGFYKFDLGTTPALNPTGSPQPITVLKQSEVLQFSKQYGFRRLNEPFKEPAKEIDISTIDHLLKSPAGGNNPGTTPPPGTDDPGIGSGGGEDLELMMKKFKKLKAKHKKCKLKKKKNSCTTKKCKTACTKVKKSLKSMKLSIMKLTGVKPK